MRRKPFIVFLIIILSLYSYANYFIYFHISRVIPDNYLARSLFTTTILLLSFSFLTGRLLERRWTSGLVYGITKVGAFWLAATLYLFLFFLASDILNFMAGIILPEPGIPGKSFKVFETITILLITGILILAGYINAINPQIKTLKISIPKLKVKGKKIRIAAVSDIHLGSIVGEKRVAKMVKMINSLNADIVIFLGDMLDEDPGPVIHKNLGSCLEKIKSKYGIYAITGNHEYIGGINKAIPFFGKHGIKLLRDEWALIENQIYLVGREDRDKVRFDGHKRKSLPDLLKGTDPSKTIILLDHQPFNLPQSKTTGVDLHLSGHTHHGQIWPFQYITKKIYKISRGYLKDGSTHYYVSSGFGTWGPPIRLGNRPEVLDINLF